LELTRIKAFAGVLATGGKSMARPGLGCFVQLFLLSAQNGWLRLTQRERQMKINIAATGFFGLANGFLLA
jgi:hypothetical protein